MNNSRVSPVSAQKRVRAYAEPLYALFNQAFFIFFRKANQIKTSTVSDGSAEVLVPSVFDKHGGVFFDIFENFARASHDRRERVFGDVDRQICFQTDALVQTFE